MYVFHVLKFVVRLEEQMKKTSLILALILVLSLSSVAATVEKRIGTQIEIFPENDGMVFDANTPFHVAHGWDYPTIMGTATLNGGAPGRHYFTLKVDGVDRQFSFLERTVLNNIEWGDYLWRYYLTIWVFNFPDGFDVGSHTFTGQWWFECGDWYGAEACLKPNDMVVVIERTITINFVEP